MGVVRTIPRPYRGPHDTPESEPGSRIPVPAGPLTPAPTSLSYLSGHGAARAKADTARTNDFIVPAIPPAPLQRLAWATPMQTRR